MTAFLKLNAKDTWNINIYEIVIHCCTLRNAKSGNGKTKCKKLGEGTRKLWGDIFVHINSHWAYVTLTLFSPKFHLLYPLKTLANLWFSNVFRGYRNRTLG